MRIAVISDTHDRYPSALLGRIKDADEIWHLGDVCDPALLEDFASLSRPLSVVRGNCDSETSWPWELTLQREGFTFFLTHIPPDQPPRGVAAVLHGHTHVPRDEEGKGVRWLNPGCITRPRGAGASFAWLVAERGRWSWKHVPLARLA